MTLLRPPSAFARAAAWPPASAEVVDASRLTTGRLTRGYVFGLSLLALLTLAGGWNLGLVLQRQEQHATVINISGAQRMLSQRLAALSALVVDEAQDGHPAAVREFLAAQHRMAASHASLLQTIADRETGSEALRAHYLRRGLRDERSLDAQVREFLELAHAVEPSAAGRQAAEQLHRLATQHLLPELHHAVLLHESAARERIDAVLRLHWLLVGAALLLLVIEAAFIFRPLVRRTGELTARLQHEARTDPLTGLLNRRATQAAIAATMARGGPTALVAIDLDFFKQANDAEGHEAGDALLRIAAGRIRQAIRQGDCVGRIGGDEFLVVLADTSEETALEVAHRLRELLHQPASYKGSILRLGATLGVALAPTHGENADAVLRAADEALMRAKRGARGSVARASAADTVRLGREAALLRALKPLDAGPLPGLTAELQPIVSLADGEVLAVEALARFRCDDLGPVPAAELFAVAGRFGLAARISAEARGRALQAYVALRREALLGGRLSINLSAAELGKPQALEALDRQCDALGLDLGALSLEITEDVLLDRVAPSTLARLAALRGRGARLVLDDFGTGTSSLAQILRLPLDEIKLDRSFIRGLGMDGRAERIVEGMIRLAGSLGILVVAEGIEDERQLRTLQGLGCQRGQGWLLGCPMTAEDLREWLLARRGDAGVVVPLRRPGSSAG